MPLGNRPPILPNRRPACRPPETQPPPNCPSADAVLAKLKAELRRAVTDFCRRRNLSREQLCDRVAAAADRPFTLAELNHWLEDCPNRRPRVEMLPALAAVLDDSALLDVLAAAAGRRVVRQSDAAHIALGRATHDLITQAQRLHGAAA